jgi:hypothetical protein
VTARKDAFVGLPGSSALVSHDAIDDIADVGIIIGAPDDEGLPVILVKFTSNT